MDKKFRFLIELLVLILSVLIIISGCEKLDTKRVIKVSTESIRDVQLTSSTAGGVIIDPGDDGVDDHGHCWSTSENPSITDSKFQLGSTKTKGSYSSYLTDLTPGTRYYVKAYAQKGNIVIYGESKTFTTSSAGLPTLSTKEVVSITHNSAESGGDVHSDGGYQVTERGICWSIDGSPDTQDFKTPSGSGTGQFTSTLTGLMANTKYYVRAYATNQLGTNYGNEVTFRTDEENGTASGDLATVETGEISTLTPDISACDGNVSDDGGSEITGRGICWNINPQPTIEDFYSQSGSGTGAFSGSLTDLQSATKYYVRAYATNARGTAYGEEKSFVTPFIDNRDETQYSVVLIGNQYWMAENLNYGKKVDLWDGQSNNSLIEKYCYDDDEYMCEIYGGLYTWHEMMQYSTQESVKGVCPSGWHLPSDDEWKALEVALGMSTASSDSAGFRGTDQGGKIKTPGTDDWYDPNTGATDESGFSAYPAGYSDYENGFEGIFEYSTFWTSTQVSDSVIWYRYVYYLDARIARYQGYSANGTPVRCVKDDLYEVVIITP